MRYAIYGLCDPAEPNTIRYVGMSANPAQRHETHCQKNANKPLPLYAWVRELREAGRKPSMVILEHINYPRDNPRQARARALVIETEWIGKQLRAGGADLNVNQRKQAERQMAA